MSSNPTTLPYPIIRKFIFDNIRWINIYQRMLILATINEQHSCYSIRKQNTAANNSCPFTFRLAHPSPRLPVTMDNIPVVNSAMQLVTVRPI